MAYQLWLSGLICVCLAFSVAPGSAFAQVIILSEDFEAITSTATEIASPMEREDGTYQSNAQVPGWTKTGVSDQFIKINGVSGNTALALNEYGTIPNTLSRVVENLVPGAEYRLSFEYWGDNCGPCGYSLEWEINGEIFSDSIASFQTDSGNFQSVVHDFIMLSDVTTLRFAETSTSAGSPVLDNIVIEQLTFPAVTDLEPLAYYPLDGSGEEATGNNIDLSPFGEPGYTPALFPGLGQALVVDGIDDALVGAGYVPSSTGQLTLSAWVFAETRTTWASIFKNWNGQFHLGIDNGLAGSGSNGKLSNYINLDGVGGQPYVVAPGLFPVGVWTHTAVVVDSTKQTQKLFIDGLHVATGVFTGSLRSNPCTGLGIAVKPRCDGSGPVTSADGGFWHGQIDEVVAWDIAFSDDQISDVYDLGASGVPLITFNQPPVANPGLSLETAVGETIQISGLGSTDDMTAPGDLDYAWTLTSQPSGSTAVLYGVGNSIASLRPDMPGLYTVELVVTDEQGAASAPAEMQVGADLDPSFVFENIFEGYDTRYRDASGSEYASEQLWPIDAGDGQAIFRRYQYASSHDYTLRTRSYIYNFGLDLFDGDGFETRFSAEYPAATTSYRYFYDARFIDDDQFRFLASYRDTANTRYRYTLLETTPEGAEVVPIPDQLDGYWLRLNTYLSADELGWLRGYGNDCLQERNYVYPDGRTYTYCIARTQAIYKLGADGPVRIIDNTSVLPPGGGLFYYFSRFAETPEGEVIFSAGILDEFGQYRGTGLFRYAGGDVAEAVLPGAIFNADGQSYVSDFRQQGDGIVFWGWYRSAGLYNDGIFEFREGTVTPIATSRTSPVRLSSWFQTNGKAIAAQGWLPYDSDRSETGAWWLDDGVLRKIASNSDTINGVTYDWVDISTNRPISETFDHQSVLLLGGRQVAYEYDASTGIYAYEYAYDTLVARFDTDRDGYGDDVDNCPLRPNEDQADADGNGIGDVCEDSDDDGTPDVLDNCPLFPNADQANDDGDNYGNLCDLCPNLNAESQADQDGNGVGDLCDPDIDGDGYDNDVDNCPVVFNDQLANLDGDAEGDACDDDIDGDGIANPVDGQIVNGVFVDESRLDSDEFTDFNLGGVSFGRILNRGQVELLIRDSEDTSQGLVAEGRSGTGQARIKWCDSKGPDGVLEIVPDTEVPITCGSIEIEPRRGHAFLLLDETVLIHTPGGTKAHLLDTNTSEILLDTEALSGLPVTMVIDDDTQVIMEGETLVHAVPEPSGQYVVENDATSANPITVVSKGIELSYAPGDAGLLVAIDIKPGSDDNPINLGSNGILPVAILSDASFDATDVDPLTVRLASSEVRLKGKGMPATQTSDVNGDGLDDLVVQVETENLVLQPTDSTAKLTGATYSGLEFIGEDFVTIVPDN